MVCLAVWAVGANLKGDFGPRQVLMMSSWGAVGGGGLSSGVRASHTCARARRPTSVSTGLTRVLLSVWGSSPDRFDVCLFLCVGAALQIQTKHTSLRNTHKWVVLGPYDG